MVGTMKIETIPHAAVRLRRRRFQRGSLQKRQSGGCWNWIAFWWEDGRRRGQLLGPCSSMSRPEALAEMAQRLQFINAHAGKVRSRIWTLGDWIREVFLPFSRRRKWKLSTASTTGDRIRKHLIADLGSWEMPSFTRDLLQQYLERKATSGLSFSLVDHLRWDLRAIFRLATQDRLFTHNPAEMLFTPRRLAPPARRVLCVASILDTVEAVPPVAEMPKSGDGVLVDVKMIMPSRFHVPPRLIGAIVRITPRRRWAIR